MSTQSAIKPVLPAGIRDYLPGDMIPRQKMLDTIRKTFESFGFNPLDTPGLEREEVLTGGDPSFKMQIFRARLRDGEEDLALRFDLTVPLARVVATYQSDLDRPFKRYQVGKVWRGEKPQAGRFREFVQFDADIVGSARTMADAEIIALMYQTMVALGFSRCVIKVNNRKLLNGLAGYVGFSQEQIPTVLRLIDKLDRLGWDNIAGELADMVGLTVEQLASLKRFLDLREDSVDRLLSSLNDLMGNAEEASSGIRELSEIRDHLSALGVPSENWEIDLSVARGLGYYTGPVFETILTDLPSIGSVFSGGRFDGLVARFGAASMPATGASIGVDRLFSAMEKLSLLPKQATLTQVLVLNFSTECEKRCQELATQLRLGGINTEIYLGKEVTLAGQIAYAVRQSVPAVLIMGGNELASGTCQVKDMATRSQAEVSFDQVGIRVSEILSR